MMRWIPVITVLFAAYLGFQWQSQRTRNPAGIVGNTCDPGKKFCAVVYLAPWCPHCKAGLPAIQSVLGKSRIGDTGVKVVVGDEHQRGDNRAMASHIASTGVTIDDDDKIARQLGVHAYPSAYILDQEGTKIIDGQEAFQWLAEKFDQK